jgi:pyridoxine 5-phosphate synthase
MTKLSVNINKIATLRNARGGNVPDLLKVATDIQNLAHKELLFILDERHIRYQDARDLKAVVVPSLISRVIRSTTSSIWFRVQPEQVTLVPDAIGAVFGRMGYSSKSSLFNRDDSKVSTQRHSVLLFC